MNGTTNTDRTLYYEVLPKNQLDLGLFLESDRMRSLAVTKDNLDNQRQAVQEERRLRREERAAIELDEPLHVRRTRRLRMCVPIALPESYAGQVRLTAFQLRTNRASLRQW